MAKQMHIRVDDDMYEELSNYSVVSGQTMQDNQAIACKSEGRASA